MKNDTSFNWILLIGGGLVVLIAIFGTFILPRLLEEENEKITVSEAFKTEDISTDKENNKTNSLNDMLSEEISVASKGYNPSEPEEEIAIADPDNYPKGVSREGNENLFVNDENYDRLSPPELEFPNIDLTDDGGHEGDLYEFLHPINIYYQAQLFDDKNFFEDISEMEYMLVLLDEHRHTIPFFHEYLGYDEDIYLCYAGRDGAVYSKYDYERGDLFYYTTSEEEMNAFNNGEMSNEDVIKSWGLVSMKYSELECAMYFLRYKSPLSEESADKSLDNKWMNY